MTIAPPIVVVGQPRSGSTVLTRLLNEGKGVFVINDFYILQKIDAQSLWGPLESEQAATLARLVFERIEIRATQETRKTLEQSIELDAAGLAKVRALVDAPWDSGLSWAQVLERVMHSAASGAGCSRWGWNTPQDYLHLERIFDAYPQARVVYQLREPAAVLSSYKNVSGPWHEARRYNPIAIGVAWKTAAKSFAHWSQKMPDQVMFLRYDEIVEHTDETVRRLSEFFDLEMPEVSLEAFGRNSSHSKGSPKQDVSPSEQAVIQKIIGDELSKRGFPTNPNAKYRLGDMPALIGIFLRSGAYLVRTVLFDRDRRRRIIRLVGIKG